MVEHVGEECVALHAGGERVSLVGDVPCHTPEFASKRCQPRAFWGFAEGGENVAGEVVCVGEQGVQAADTADPEQAGGAGGGVERGELPV